MRASWVDHSWSGRSDSRAKAETTESSSQVLQCVNPSGCASIRRWTASGDRQTFSHAQRSGIFPLASGTARAPGSASKRNSTEAWLVLRMQATASGVYPKPLERRNTSGALDSNWNNGRSAR